MTAERLLLRRAKVLNGAEVDIVIADGNVVQIVPVAPPKTMVSRSWKPMGRMSLAAG